MLFSSFILAFFLLLGTVQGATRYADPAGSGTACTDRNTPCTLSTAWGQSVGGDTVTLLDGIYHFNSDLNSVKGGSSNTSRITLQAENRHQAILSLHETTSFSGSNNSDGFVHGLDVRHSNLTIRRLVVDCNQRGWTCLRIYSGSGVNNVTIEDNYFHDVGHALAGVWNTNNWAIRHNWFSESGWTSEDGECLYLSSSGGGNPVSNGMFEKNVCHSFTSNVIDWKEDARTTVAQYNLMYGQRNERLTTVIGSRAGTWGGDGNIRSQGNNTSAGNFFRNNIMRDGVGEYLIRFSSNRVDALNNAFLNMSSQPFIDDRTTSSANIKNNVARGSLPVSLGTCGSNCSGNIIQATLTEYNNKVASIIGAPSMASCEIGATGNTTVVVDLQTDLHPPVSRVGNLQVTYDGVAQTESAIALVAGQQAHITMAAQPVSSSVVVQVSALSGDIENSLFMGGLESGGSVDSPVLGKGINGKNTGQTIICGNSVGGTPPMGDEQLSQAVWRFAAIHRAEGEAWMAPENVNIASYPGDRFRWRVGVRGGGVNAPSRGYGLFARLCTPTCTNWMRVTNDSSQIGIAYLDDQLNDFGTPTTNQLTLGGKNFKSAVFVDDTASIPAVAIGVNEQVEFEYGLKIDRDAVSEGANIQLRVQHDSREVFDTYSLPTISVCRGESSIGGDAGGAR